MADDRFWDPQSDNQGKWYASTYPGGGALGIGDDKETAALVGTSSGGALATVSAVNAINPNKTIVLSITRPLMIHKSNRLQAHPGGPKLRSPGSHYPRTKLTMPPVKVTTTGKSGLPLKVIKSTVKMPDNFCYAPSDLTEAMDQGACGSCWAFSLCHMLADRVALMTNGKTRAALSTRQIMECGDYMNGIKSIGCDGNDPYIVVKSIQEKPINMQARDQYPHHYDQSNTDPSACVLVDSTNGYSVSCKSAFMISEPIGHPGDAANKRNIENMKQHIYNEGPIIGTFTCYHEFVDYDGLTIYEPSEDTKSEEAGGHAIELIGWGKDPATGTSYWVGRNSWGEKWPSQHRKCAGVGYFYFKMGENACKIEEYASGATPIIHNANKAPKNGDGSIPGMSCGAQNLINGVRVGSTSIQPYHIAIPLAVIAFGYVVWYYRDDIKKKIH